MSEVVGFLDCLSEFKIKDDYAHFASGVRDEFAELL